MVDFSEGTYSKHAYCVHLSLSSRGFFQTVFFLSILLKQRVESRKRINLQSHVLKLLIIS